MRVMPDTTAVETRPDDTQEKKMEKNRRHVCVYTHYFPARSETFIREHVLGLVRQGYRVTVLAREPGNDIHADEVAEIDAIGIERLYLGNFTTFSTKLTRLLNWLKLQHRRLLHPRWGEVFRTPGPWTLRELLIASKAVQLIARRRFDLVHVHFGHLAALLQLFSSDLPDFPPMVVTWHGYDVNVKPKQLGKDAYRALFSSPAWHTVGSGFIARRLVELGARAAQVERIPMGVDLQRFTYSERRRKAGDPLHVLSVGRLEEVKGHTHLIEAVRRLRNEHVAVHLRIAGDGPLMASLQEQIQRAGMGDCVELMGSINASQVAEAMRAADVFALTGVETSTGKVESQGVVFAEAQATGLPVVASRLGGVPESVVDGESAYLCEAGDVDAIVGAIMLFAGDPERCVAFGQRGRSHVEAEFSIERMMMRFDALYSRAWGLV